MCTFTYNWQFHSCVYLGEAYTVVHQNVQARMFLTVLVQNITKLETNHGFINSRLNEQTVVYTHGGLYHICYFKVKTGTICLTLTDGKEG